MDEETQAVHTPTPSDKTNNHTRNGSERASRGGTHRNATRKKKSEILNTFKGSMLEVGAVIGTKDTNFKESFQNLQECVLKYVAENYKKGVDLVPLISKLEDFELSSKEPKSSIGNGSKDLTEISKKRYELELKKKLGQGRYPGREYDKSLIPTMGIVH